MNDGPICDLSKPWEEPEAPKLTQDFPAMIYSAAGIKGRAFRGIYAAGNFPPSGEFVMVAPDLDGLETAWNALMVPIQMDRSKAREVVIVEAGKFEALLEALQQSSGSGG